MYAFFLAMTLFPDVQKKAQAQIDAVIGVDRLPTFADRGSLPYVEAVVKEVLRWHTVTPLGNAYDPCGVPVIPFHSWAWFRNASCCL